MSKSIRMGNFGIGNSLSREGSMGPSSSTLNGAWIKGKIWRGRYFHRF